MHGDPRALARPRALRRLSSSTLILLLCLVGPAGPAFARDLSADGRGLLQNEVDCKRSIDYCVTCRYAFFHGTVTKAICLSCDPGYVVAREGRECWCAPGYYYDGATCAACGPNNYCPGSVSAIEDATQNSCGTNKITTTNYAKSVRECVVNPGYGWAEGDGSAICTFGFYNPGYNSRACSKCPGGLTTAAEGSTSTAQCKAPAGFYYLRGRAVACAQGTYKAAVANADCDECADGLTTVFGEVGKTAVTDCGVIKPGYGAVAGHAAGSIAAVICPANSYRTGELAYDSTAGIPCTTCGSGSRTMPGATGATSSNACLAPPGYGWNADGTSTICDFGYFNPGWNREACTKCGEGTITTAAKGSTSADQCYTPAGNGNKRSADGLTLTGFACPVNTYGRATKTTGLVDVECTKCMEHTSTQGADTQTNVAACVADAGYGYYDGEVRECAFGYWSAAGGRDACEFCGMGYNTTDDGSVGITGADSQDQCDIAAGWESDGGTGAAKCRRGFYKPTISSVPCTKCVSGTTTSLMAGAIARSDCDTCRPGFGGTVDLANPSCTMCTSGYYSPGFTPGGQQCVTCPKPDIFSGKMVSRNGISTPEDCVGEFVSDGADTFLEWDVLRMPAASLSADSADSVEDCQAACSGSNLGCQYYVFTSYAAAGSRCQLRLAGAPIAKVAFAGEDAPAAPLLFFEVSESVYTVYAAADAADAGGVGTTLNTYTTFDAALSACDFGSTCVGFAWTGATWRTFRGQKWEGATGKVRVVGETLNSWIAEPRAN